VGDSLLHHRPTVVASPTLVRTLFQDEPVPPEVLLGASEGIVDTTFALDPGKVVAMEVRIERDSLWTQNVVGVVRGRDPTLADEWVVIGAHYDHLGTGHPGADDNASGTAGLLGVARAFALGPRPRRSVAFVWFAGEERGLWGSRWAVESAMIPAEKIVAMVNLDMIGRSGREDGSNDEWATDSHEVLAVGARSSSAALSTLVEGVDRDFVELDYRFMDDDSMWWFTASDHGPYHDRGIPFVWMFTGFHDDYHGASDIAESVDFEKLTLVTRASYVTAWRIAEEPSSWR